jgi:tRNA(Ser,Leu) C12 N-acetylase TAN1
MESVKAASKKTIPIQRGSFKSKYLRKHASLLQESSRGLLISTLVREETRALGQARTLLETYFLELFPDAIPQWKSETEKDVDESFINAKMPMQAPNDPATTETNSRKDRFFQAVDTACSGVIFIRFKSNISPLDFMTAFIKHSEQMDEQTRKDLAHSIRYCHRFVPIEFICPSYLPEIISNVPVFLHEKWPQIQPNETVALLTEIRNSTTQKQDVIDSIAKMFPEELKINLSNPKWTILVSIFKSCCGVSVLPNYKMNAKYNLRALLQKA